MRIKMQSRLALVFTTLVLGAGCAPGRSAMSGPTPESGSRLRAQAPTRANVVDQEEIRAVETGYTALEAVQRLRPEFLGRHAAPRPGDRLYSADLGAQSSGMVVNAAHAPEDGFDALAVIQITSAESRAVRWKSPAGPALKLLPLPYAQ